MRATRFIGIARQVDVKDLQPGMCLIDPIIGYDRKILVNAGEVLSKKHVEQLDILIKRTGVGCLLNYTRKVWAQATDASGDERPACDADPYQAFSVQRLFKKSMDTKGIVAGARPGTARKVYKMIGGKLTEVEA